MKDDWLNSAVQVFFHNQENLFEDLNNPHNNQLYNDNSFLFENNVKSDDLNNYDSEKDYNDNEEFERISEEEEDLFQIKSRESNINIDDKREEEDLFQIKSRESNINNDDKLEEEDDLFQIKSRESNINIDYNSKQKNCNEPEKKFIDITFKFKANIISNKSTKPFTKNNDNTLNNALELKEKTKTIKKRKIINKQNMGCKKKTERIMNYDINEKKGPHHKGKTDNIDIKLKRAYLKYLTLFINFITDKIPNVKKKEKYYN